MSFLDKVKSGFSEAGSKAKVVMEVNKLKMQNNKKQIKQLANEKDCVCGRPALLDARFCSSCGHTFPDSVD